MEQAPAPVGSAHQKIVPLKELPSLTEREKFWIQEESKEKERIAAEKHRKVSERKTIEEERKRRRKGKVWSDSCNPNGVFFLSMNGFD